MQICVSTLHFLTVIVKFVPGEVHLGYVITSCGYLILPFGLWYIRWSYVSSIFVGH